MPVAILIFIIRQWIAGICRTGEMKLEPLAVTAQQQCCSYVIRLILCQKARHSISAVACCFSLCIMEAAKTVYVGLKIVWIENRDWESRVNRRSVDLQHYWIHSTELVLFRLSHISFSKTSNEPSELGRFVPFSFLKTRPYLSANFRNAVAIFYSFVQSLTRIIKKDDI